MTIEANPETVDRRALRGLRAMGVTRLSVGVQSFRPHLLAALDRAASPQQARDVVGCARAAGFENVSIDLLFGVPGQTPGDLEPTSATPWRSRPSFVSWYELELKPGSALARRGLPPVDEDEGADAYRRIVSGLEAAGYRWYETANFARGASRLCRRTAWPTGARATTSGWASAPSAPSADGDGATGRAWRRTSPRWPAARNAAPHVRSPRRRRRAPRALDAWPAAGRRPRPGVVEPAGRRPEALRRLAAAGLLCAGDGAVALTREGRFVQNAVLHQLMEYA